MVLYPQSRRAAEEYQPDLPADPKAIAAGREENRRIAAEEDREPVDHVLDVDADGVPCRLYRPDGASAVILHRHGGGFVYHDIDVHDAAVRRLVNRSDQASRPVGSPRRMAWSRAATTPGHPGRPT